MKNVEEALVGFIGERLTQVCFVESAGVTKGDGLTTNPILVPLGVSSVYLCVCHHLLVTLKGWSYTVGLRA